MPLASLALAVVALGLALWLAWQVRSLRGRLDTVLGGGAPDSLEAHIGRYAQRVEAVDGRLTQLNRHYERLDTMVGVASQKIAIVRFNPFGDTGGDQSFSLAVLDSHNSGYVLTSIHGREGTRSYVKPVDYGKSKYALSAEEKQALELAERRVPVITAEEE